MANFIQTVKKAIGLKSGDPMLVTFKQVAVASTILEVAALAFDEYSRGGNVWASGARYSLIALIEVLFSTLFINSFYKSFGAFIYTGIYPEYLGKAPRTFKGLATLWKDLFKEFPALMLNCIWAALFFGFSFWATTSIYMTYLSENSDVGLVVSGFWDAAGFAFAQMMPMAGIAIESKVAVVWSIYSTQVLNLMVILYSLYQLSSFLLNSKAFDHEKMFEPMFKVVKEDLRSPKVMKMYLKDPDIKLLAPELRKVEAQKMEEDEAPDADPGSKSEKKTGKDTSSKESKKGSASKKDASARKKRGGKGSDEKASKDDLSDWGK